MYTPLLKNKKGYAQHWLYPFSVSFIHKTNTPLLPVPQVPRDLPRFEPLMQSFFFAFLRRRFELILWACIQMGSETPWFHPYILYILI